MPSFYLIDAHAYLHRAFHALPPLTTSRGEPVGAVYGFMRMLIKILKQHKPDYVAVCFDTAAPTFRHQAFADYKATRKETDRALVSQFPLSREAVDALGLTRFELDGYEADDVMAHLARLGEKKGWDVVVVTADKDALQLVNDHVKVLNESKDVLFDAAQVKALWGVEPRQIPDILALMGDASDNVPGVRGIGEKTAVKLIQEYGDLDHLLSAASRLKGKTGTLLTQGAQEARQSLMLVTLNKEMPLVIKTQDCAVHPLDTAKLSPFLQRLELMSLLKELTPNANRTVDSRARDYQILHNEDQLKRWCEAALKAERLAVDVETDGLNPRSAALVGISLSTQPETGVYIPLRHLDAAPFPLDVLQKYLSSLLMGRGPKLYGHNLKFDAAVLARHGLPLSALHVDTMVASYVLNPSRHSHGLKDLSLEILGEPMTPIEALIGKGAKQITMDAVSVNQAAPYACADVDMTLRLAGILEPKLKESALEKLFYELEMPLITVLSVMEEKGIRIDRPYLAQLGREFQKSLQELEAQAHRLAGESFNLGSPKQLGVILFEKLKLPVVRRTKTGVSTDEETLQKLSSHHPLPKAVLQYREVQKLYSTYVESLLAAADSSDRVHTSFNQTVAATGRLSSSDPNLQNIPIRTESGRRIRQAFVPAPGMKLLSADYSQIDLRMLAHISKDPVLIAAFKAGEDIHTATASDIFGVKPEDVSPEMRRVAKSINFGIVYGMSAYGLAAQLGIAAEEAQAHIERYFARYAGVKTWMASILEQARKEGLVRTLLGRIRHLPEIQSTNGAVRGFAERMAMNTPIQGTSADVIKVAMLQLAHAREQKEWRGDMLLQVHDELVFEIPEAEFSASCPVIKRIMENAVQLDIPVVVDLKTGPNWSEMKKMAV